MQTNAAGERSGFSRPPTQRNALKSFSRILSGRSVLRGGGDGFAPVMVAAAVIASALLLALD